MKIVDKTTAPVKEISIVEAQYLDDLRLKIFFNDDSSRIVDLADFLENAHNPLFKKFLKKKNFKNFKIINGNLNWNDYEMIFPVWDLYRGVV